MPKNKKKSRLNSNLISSLRITKDIKLSVDDLQLIKIWYDVCMKLNCTSKAQQKELYDYIDDLIKKNGGQNDSDSKR